MEISARGGAQASDAKNAIELLMSGKWMKQHQTHPSPAVWQLIALHPLQILVWLAQVGGLLQLTRELPAEQNRICILRGCYHPRAGSRTALAA